MSKISFFLNTLLFLYVLIAGNPVQAQELKPWSFNVYLENDLFADTDINYTNGIRFSGISPDLNSFTDEQGQPYPWIENLNTAFDFLYPSSDFGDEVLISRNIVITLGQLMFTPTDREATQVLENERPYAGWLYLGVGYHARSEKRLHSAEINLGVIGPASLARESQNLIHRIRDIDLFQGWHNQLKNEPGIQLIYEEKLKHFKTEIDATQIEIDLISHWGGSLGNVATYLNGGAELRLGYNLPNDFGTSTLRPGGDNHSPGFAQEESQPFRLYGFAATDARLVLQNIFLDGNTFRNSHQVDKKHFVSDLSLGITSTWKKWTLSYAHVWRSKEFNSQNNSQFYGSLSLSYKRSF